ncbi:MAG: KH domain-containing protein [Acidobacteriota bacterium]
MDNRRRRTGAKPMRPAPRPAPPRSLSPHQLRSLLEYLVNSLVDDKQAVVVTEREKQGKIYYNIKVAKNDMGKLLGRAGKTISCVRNVMRAAAAKAGGEVVVDVLEEER